MDLVVDARRVACPFCGRVVLMLDSQCTVLHQAPVCDAFSEQLTKFGLNSQRREWTALTVDDSRAVVLIETVKRD
ncbi:MAG TPA: hypothetical protein VF420_13345 [Casimicrobiaceae bacterium]